MKVIEITNPSDPNQIGGWTIIRRKDGSRHTILVRTFLKCYGFTYQDVEAFLREHERKKMLRALKMNKADAIALIVKTYSIERNTKAGLERIKRACKVLDMTDEETQQTLLFTEYYRMEVTRLNEE